MLENVDLNGVVLLSTILSFDNSVDGPRCNPGVDQAYALALPTYAATAFYHKKLPTQPPALAAVPHRGRELRARRLHVGAAPGLAAAGRPAAGDRREAARLHRAAGRLPAEGEPARRGRDVLEDAGGSRGTDHRPARHALPGAGHRSAVGDGRVRPAVERDLVGLHDGDQRLPAQRAEVRARLDLQAQCSTATGTSSGTCSISRRACGSPSARARPT